MSQLQKAAKPLLTPMIVGQDLLLTAADKATVASWAAMTAITMTYKGHFEIPEGRRKWMHEYHEPASQTSVWLCKVIPGAEVTMIPHLRTLPEEDPTCRLLGLQFGQLGLVVLHETPHPVQINMLRALEKEVLLPIWPINLGPQSWPRKATISIGGFFQLLHGLGIGKPVQPEDVKPIVDRLQMNRPPGRVAP